MNRRDFLQPSLEWLVFRFTKVTDAGLKTLSGLKSLRVLDLVGAQVTDAAVKELRLTLPRCEVGH